MDVIFEPERQGRRLRPFCVKVGFFDTVLNIKERIQQYQGIPVPIQTLVFNDQVLEDDSHAATCGIRQNSNIKIKILEVRFPPMKIQLRIKVAMMLDRPVRPILSIRLQSSSGGAEAQDHCLLGEFYDEWLMNNSATNARIIISPPAPALHLVLLSLCRTTTAVVKVDARDNVEVLRNQLPNLNLSGGFPLPEEGYMFSHNQNLMSEIRSFQWHNVREGDTIQIISIFVPRRGGGGGGVGGSLSMQSGGSP